MAARYDHVALLETADLERVLDATYDTDADSRLVAVIDEISSQFTQYIQQHTLFRIFIMNSNEWMIFKCGDT